jgi:hypothetical protein
MLYGSGVAAAEARTVAPFDAIELAGSNIVDVHVGGAQSVVVHADDNLLDRVVTEVRGGTLVVGNRNGGFAAATRMRVEVTVPKLGEIALSGSGSVVVDGIDAERVAVALSGSGEIRAQGTTTRLDVTVDGSGDARLDELVAADVRAVVSGTGRILVTATRTLDASVPGTGTVVYGGEPEHVRSNVSGIGAVTRGA